MSQATGLQFVYDGATSEAPSTQREIFQPDRYGDHWVPVLFAWDGTRLVHAVVLHELGHLVGLAHVADQTQLMFPESSYAVTDFQSGDLTGAAILGRGVCTPDL